MAEQRAVHWWVRVQIGILTLLLIAMTGYRFLKSNPPLQIDAYVLVVLALIVVLVLSETFDNFSVGKLISISRKVEEKEKEVSKLEDQNAKLFSQLITISSHQAQSQTHTNVYGDYHAAPSVQKATEEEVEESRQREARADVAEPEAPQAGADEQPVRVSPFRIEEVAFQRYVASRGLAGIVLPEAKLVTDFRDLDTISNTAPIFDGYAPSPTHETFIEVKAIVLTPSFRDRLYMMLSKIDHYRRRKGVDAHLELVIASTPTRQVREVSEKRLRDEFQPALASGLLKIEKIVISEAEEAALAVQEPA